MTKYLSTGATARLLGTTEPQLNSLIRRGKVKPEPELIAGRRAWCTAHIQCAARLLDAPLPGTLLSPNRDARGEAPEGPGVPGER